VDTADAEWVARYVQPTGPARLEHDRPWAAVWRVPVPGGQVWFKRCAPIQSFEPRLTAALAVRSPDLMPELIAHDHEGFRLLLGDAGSAVSEHGNAPEVWLALLPAYAELQRREIAFAEEHLAARVPDLRVELLAGRYPELLDEALPVDAEQRSLLRAFEATFAQWCDQLARAGIPASIQHDDLHHHNVYLRDGHIRVLDWGDSSISHPFMSLVVTFRFLEHINRLAPTDSWFARLRDAYLEPWGHGHGATFDLAMRVGIFAHAIAWNRQRRALPPSWRPEFDEDYRDILGRATRIAARDRA
jgi:hypothetical protein